MSGITLNHLAKFPKNKNVGIGCIGSGFIMADCHLVAYRNNGFNPVAISSRRLENAQKTAGQHGIKHVYDDHQQLLNNKDVEVVDIAVPPNLQLDMIRDVVKHDHIKGILAQKPLAMNYGEAKEIVRLCKESGKVLCVNQNMRYDHSIRACKDLLNQNVLGRPVLASIDMCAIPHWMPWQQSMGWCTLRTMSIHHLDTFRYLLGDPIRVFASTRPDPRTTFEHSDGICLYILEYENGLRAIGCDDVWTGPAREGSAEDIYIRWKVEGLQGLAKGTIGWPHYPTPTPSTLDYSTTKEATWHKPRWDEVWFPDAFVGPMAELLCALEEGEAPSMNGDDNLKTMALVDACYLSAKEHRAVEISEIMETNN